MLSVRIPCQRMICFDAVTAAPKGMANLLMGHWIPCYLGDMRPRGIEALAMYRKCPRTANTSQDAVAMLLLKKAESLSKPAHALLSLLTYTCPAVLGDEESRILSSSQLKTRQALCPKPEVAASEGLTMSG